MPDALAFVAWTVAVSLGTALWTALLYELRARRRSLRWRWPVTLVERED